MSNSAQQTDLILALVFAALNLGVGTVLGIIATRLWRAERVDDVSGPAGPAPSTSAPAAVLVSEVESQLEAIEQSGDAAERIGILAAEMADSMATHRTSLEDTQARLASLEGRDLTAADLTMVVSQLIEENKVLIARLHDTEEQLDDQTHELQRFIKEARTDPLTGLQNRRAFDQDLRRRFEENRRKQVPFCLILLDIDHFKSFNDTYGHAAGDEVLRGVARALVEGAREMDIVARFGGEEFAVILPSTELRDARIAAERIRSTVEAQSFQFCEQSFRATVSVGLCSADSAEGEAAIVEQADQALYAAKGNGRNRGYYYDDGECRPIVSEPASPNPRDQRRHERRTVDEFYLVGPLPETGPPDLTLAQQVLCHDISNGGFSFYSNERPVDKKIFLVLEADDEQKCMAAEILHSREVEREGKLVFLNGCQFFQRMDIDIGTVSPAGQALAAADTFD